ncbi:MAG: hypothetical protein R3C26_26670 [Calditrichia bacterium]
MPVAPEDRETFTTAYQCSSLISIWNLPPFMFSTTNPELQAFKEQRAEAMRMDSFRSYAKLDSIFYRYYTTIDCNDTLITQLADELTAGKATPYDKVESVVDYFWGKTKPANRASLTPSNPAHPVNHLCIISCSITNRDIAFILPVQRCYCSARGGHSGANGGWLRDL